MTSAVFPFSHVVAATLPAGKPQDLTIVPSGEDLARIAETYGLVGLRDIALEVTLRPWKRQGVALDGRLRGIAVQSCVVTLAPLEQLIDERFVRHFDPAAEADGEGAEIEVDALAEDPPEPLVGGRIDLGAVLCEQLALVLDPFPRADGAEVPEAFRAPEGEADDPDDRPPSPFAKLASLRKPQD